MQDEKEPLFDAIDTVTVALTVFTAIWETLEVRGDRVEENMDDAMLATDLADYLTRCGLPFRKGHGIVASLVDEAMKRGCSLRDLPLDLYRRHSEHFDEATIRQLRFDDSADKRALPGGTGRDSVLRQLEQAREILGCG